MDSGRCRCVVTGPMVVMVVMMVMMVMMKIGSCAHTQITVAVGGTISLKPRGSTNINSVVWKHQGNLVVEWIRSDLEFYPDYVNRSSLNTSTGQLDVRHVTVKDTGLFTVEVNSQIQQEGYNVRVLKKVSTPTIVSNDLACGPKSKSCNLLCESEVEGAGPVFYSWLVGAEWTQEKIESSFDLVKNNQTEKQENIYCRVKNEVSEEKSGLFKNPFYDPGLGPGPIAGICVSVVVLVGIAGFGIWKKKEISEWICPQGEGEGDDGGPANHEPSTTEPLKGHDGNSGL